jgi:hypothetical protein
MKESFLLGFQNNEEGEKSVIVFTAVSPAHNTHGVPETY